MTTPNELPTWNAICDSALAELNISRSGLSNARDWLQSDWAEGRGPVDPAQRHEAARLIAEAKGLIDQAKNALYSSAEK